MYENLIFKNMPTPPPQVKIRATVLPLLFLIQQVFIVYLEGFMEWTKLCKTASQPTKNWGSSLMELVNDIWRLIALDFVTNNLVIF